MPNDGTCGPGGLYRRRVAGEGARVLGMLDRDPTSPTAGCLDRSYWAWKFVDFPGARYQEGVCALAYLYRSEFEGNRYHGRDKLLAWIRLALRYWTTLQHGDGSFDEAYPFERSLAATAFSSFYLSEALELLGDALDRETRTPVVDALARAGRWLERNDEDHGCLSNHLAAAAAACVNVGRLTGENGPARRADHFLDRILSRQSDEGWYEEYGGADPGYQTHGTFYLARIWQRTGDATLLESLKRANAFLSVCLHPDGSLGGEYTSRNTQTYYPAAFEMLAEHDPAAAWIAGRMACAVTTGSAAGLKGIDPQNYFPCLNNLVFASIATEGRAGRPAGVEPRAQDPLVWFPQAGIARIRRPSYDAFVGTSKGGVVKVFDRQTGRLAGSNAGYHGRTRTGQVASTQYLDHDREVVVSSDLVRVNGGLRAGKRPVMTPWLFLGFRLFSLTLGRWPAVGRWLKRLLVKVLIYRRRSIEVAFRREIRFELDRVRIADTLGGPGADRLAGLQPAESFVTIHMGSARYFVPHELDLPVASNGRIAPSALRQGVTIESTIAPATGGPS